MLVSISLDSVRQQICGVLQNKIDDLCAQQEVDRIKVKIEPPKDPSHGDLACYAALSLAKHLQKNPRAIAEVLVEVLADHSIAYLIERTTIAGPGFVNISLKNTVWQALLQTVLTQKELFGKQPQTTPPAQVLVEFVSANPTGPLHVGHARQAALGDAIAKLFETQGFKATREFYYNDAGQQIENLALSVQARAKGILPSAPNFPTDGYRGEYIEVIATAFQNQESVEGTQVPLTKATGNIDDLDAVRRFAVAYLRREQELDLAAFGLKFDVYSLESVLYKNGQVETVVNSLKEKGVAYEQDGALWLKTSDFGDDKDRVMKKTEGGYTYFVPDLAYHVNKWQRGFKRAINVQGMDHHGTIARVRAGLQALSVGIPTGWPDYVLHKMVTVMKDGEEVKISKRAGSYVTLRDLIDWTGKDAVRFFLISRKADTEFVFDVNLAQEQSENNPVFYVQYAHARICAIQQQSKNLDGLSQEKVCLDLLIQPEELVLMKELANYPDVLTESCRTLSPHMIAFYVRELAQKFHSYYNAHRILVEDKALCVARLQLLKAIQQVLASALDLLGVNAPEKM